MRPCCRTCRFADSPRDGVGSAGRMGERMTEQSQRLTGRPDAATIERVRSTLSARFGNRLSASPSLREQHANTTTWVANQPPDVVVYPQSAEEIAWVVGLCSEHLVPVIAFG